MTPMRDLNRARRFSIVGNFVHLSVWSWWFNVALFWLEARRVYWSVRWMFPAVPGWGVSFWRVMPSTHHPEDKDPRGRIGLIWAIAILLFLLHV